MSYYIPDADSEFNEWIKNFKDYVNNNYAALGLTPEQNTKLQTAWASWGIDYPAHITGKATAESLSQRKNLSRAELENVARELTGIIQSNSAVTNEQRAALQITVPKETKTPVPVPTTRPMANIDNRYRLEHTIHFFDEATPNSKAKPFGVRGCEIWVKVGGPAPTGVSECKFLTTDTRSPHIVRFDEEDANKVAHYLLRWVNTRNETGPWSETISVTISG